MKELFELLKIQLNNAKLIIQLAKYNLKIEYSNHYLGMFWNILQPLMQVAIYYVVFGLGLRGSTAPNEEIPFIIHLITGLFPWLFISQAINTGSNALLSQLDLVTKMKFPSSTLLSISLTNSFINLLFTTLIIVVISIYQQYVSVFHYLEFIYFVFASYAIIFGITLIMSTLIVMVRDLKNVLQNIIRMGFFLTPIFWQIETVNPLFQKIVALNPFAYLVGIYRNAFIHGDKFIYGAPTEHLYFWTLTITLLVIGAIMHKKFNAKLIDYL